jgi:hypothetical protein
MTQGANEHMEQVLFPDSARAKPESIANRDDEEDNNERVIPLSTTPEVQPRKLRRDSSLESILSTKSGITETEVPSQTARSGISIVPKDKSSLAGFPSWWKNLKPSKNDETEYSNLASSQSKLNAKVSFFFDHLDWVIY